MIEPQRTTYAPVEPRGDVARRNIVLGWALVAIAVLMAAGAVVVSLIYLHYD